jgi:hypothetical protein
MCLSVRASARGPETLRRAPLKALFQLHACRGVLVKRRMVHCMTCTAFCQLRLTVRHEVGPLAQTALSRSFLLGVDIKGLRVMIAILSLRPLTPSRSLY